MSPRPIHGRLCLLKSVVLGCSGALEEAGPWRRKGHQDPGTFCHSLRPGCYILQLLQTSIYAWQTLLATDQPRVGGQEPRISKPARFIGGGRCGPGLASGPEFMPCTWTPPSPDGPTGEFCQMLWDAVIQTPQKSCKTKGKEGTFSSALYEANHTLAPKSDLTAKLQTMSTVMKFLIKILVNETPAMKIKMLYHDQLGYIPEEKIALEN